MPPLKLISRIPKAFREPFARVNAAIRILNAMATMDGRGGINITKSEGNWIIEYNPNAVGSDGLPDPVNGTNGAGGGGASTNVYDAAISVSGTVPTPAEFVSAIQGVSYIDSTPLKGDIINLTVSGYIKFRSTLTQTEPADTGTLWSQTLSLGGDTWYAMTHQTGLY